MASLVEKLMVLFPEEYPMNFGVIHEDGVGDKIENWQLADAIPTQEELDAVTDADVITMLAPGRIEILWDAANKQIHDQVSGGAIPKIMMMAEAGHPEAIQAVMWYEAEWAEYYRRRDEIVTLGDTNYDFSDRPLIPVSVRSLMGM